MPMLRLILPLIALLLAALPARAQWAEMGSSGWVETAEADVRLVGAEGATGDRDAVTLGLHFRLRDGWKVYWRAAGDAGYPPEIDWTGSENLDSATMRYPAPHRFSVLGIETAGYKDEVVYPITVRLAETGKALEARAGVDYLICSEICVPGRVDLALSVPGGPGGPTDFAHLIESWEARVPGDGAGHGLRLAEAAVETGGDRAVLRAVVRADPPLDAAPDLFVEGPEALRVGAPEVSLSDGGATAVLRAPVREGALTGSEPVTLTIVEGDRGMEATVTPPLAPATGADAGDAAVLAGMLGLAVLGGLILNIMPCVLPVLSLKVMGVAHLGGAERRTVRLAFLASAAGIVFTFLVLAGGAAGLKLAGAAVGWGIQFQQPLFLVAMIVLLSLFAANLWGFFEIRLPGAVSDAAVASAGGGGGHGLAGHFGSGVFATLLATPCSAPFLGTAIGFALARGPLEIIAIFAALGVGMSLPYLTVAAAPGLARILPRPGRWMLRVKVILGAALAATAVWLLWVLSAQVGTTAALAVAGLMAAAVAVLAVRRSAPGLRGGLAGAMVAALAATAFTVPWWNAAATPAGTASAVSTAWTTFDRDAIAMLVSQGKVVFVDVTADWCVTCKVNKAAVIERGAVAEALKAPAVVAMQADWTNPDDGISRYLNSFGRYGIPFNAVYGPGAPDGIVLPELLTEGVVMEALAKAGAPVSG